MNVEEFIIERMRKFGVLNDNIIKKKYYYKKVNANDNGVDFTLKVKQEYFVCQLKYWNKKLNNKIIKQIFGDLYLSEVSCILRSNNSKLNYILLCPFIGRNVMKSINSFTKENYYIIAKEEFIEFLTNPYYFLIEITESKEDKYGSGLQVRLWKD